MQKIEEVKLLLLLNDYLINYLPSPEGSSRTSLWLRHWCTDNSFCKCTATCFGVSFSFVDRLRNLATHDWITRIFQSSSVSLKIIICGSLGSSVC